jgi:hypothetical protein
MKEIKLPGVTPSDAAQKLLRLQGTNYSLKDYPMFVDIFNTPYTRRVMRAGRQVSKTITIAADIVTEAALSAYNSLIYINASGSQTTSFSTSKLDPFLVHSPVIYQSLMQSKHCIDNIYNKRFGNFSELRLSYFSESADRIRGASAKRLYVDEIQDILYDAIIDAEECLSAAVEPRFTYAGTSKSVVTSLEYLWEQSTQKQWIIKCDGCGKWNIPSKENIYKEGFMCKNPKCHTRLDTYTGLWHSFCPGDPKDKLYDGYDIPQVIMPMHCNNPVKWEQLFNKFESYPSYKFDNEIMGKPVGEGDQPITVELIQKMCLESLQMYPKVCPENSTGASFIVAGADWGGSGVSGTSRTTLSIYAVYPERAEYIKIFCKVYGAGEPTQHLQDIALVLRAFRVTILYGDHGNGNFAMSQLASYVPDIQIIPVMYTEQAAPYKWDSHARRFTVNRTVMIDTLLVDIKKSKVRTFRYSDFKPFSEDLLNVREDYINEARGISRRVWRRHPKKPDDVLHSMVFGWFAARVASGDLDFCVSGGGVGVGGSD